MGKLIDETKKEIERKTVILEKLREEFDRADANDFFNQSEIARKISNLASELASLEEFYKKLEVLKTLAKK
jgi:hypothetical protein